MKTIMTAGAALLLTTSIATAGGLDRSGQPIGVIFEEGSYAELSFGLVQPDVSGVAPALGGASSGNMAQDYTNLGLAYKRDINDQLSFALIFDQPFGAAIDYTNADPGYALGVPPVTAEINSSAITALGRYKVNDRFSVHGGLRYVTMSAEIDSTAAGGGVFDYDNSSDLGYVIGAAYEIPDIALRAALTYSSATTHQNDVTFAGAVPAGTTNEYTMPQSVNLDFQTGIAADTLLLAGVRWADWTETEIDTAAGGLGVIDYDNDAYTFNVGVARRFTDDLAGLVRVTYEKANGGAASNLAPTDGSVGLTLAAIYDVTDEMTVTAGINYTRLGDATTEGLGAEFSDNSAVGFGLKVGYSF